MSVRSLCLIVGGLVAGCVAATAVPRGADAAPAAVLAAPGFALSGSIDGLYPGFAGVLSVRVENPFDRALRMTGLSATVAATEPAIARCGDHLAVGGLSGQPVVPAQSAYDVELWVSFGRAAPDECQGISIPLRFAAEALLDAPSPAGPLPATGVSAAAFASVAAIVLGAGTVVAGLARRWRS